jgi:hypothetical protein
MVVPPDALLKLIRVLGSVLLVAGMAAFLLCAIQVYAHKLLKKGAALRASIPSPGTTLCKTPLLCEEPGLDPQA